MKRAWVLHPVLQGCAPARSPEQRIAEAARLVSALSLKVAGSDSVVVRRPNPGTLLGSGMVRRYAERFAHEAIDLAVVDGPLSPVQQRNLERDWQLKVLDRSGLILEIFGERAQSAEGRIQVEHAHLTYQKSRLVRSWTHLERQRGGFGFLGGPGETQIEADRRAIDTRLRKLGAELRRIERSRNTQRGARRRSGVPTVALVGYTNAGKSTLFNCLCEAGTPIRDMLFTTLDPTARALRLPGGRRAVISDTVGFVSDLPVELIAAFRATLGEVRNASALLHVIDASSPERDIQRQDTLDTLAMLEISPDCGPPILEVYNKRDLLDAQEDIALAARVKRSGTGVTISARDATGVRQLLAEVEGMLTEGFRSVNRSA